MKLGFALYPALPASDSAPAVCDITIVRPLETAEGYAEVAARLLGLARLAPIKCELDADRREARASGASAGCARVPREALTCVVQHWDGASLVFLCESADTLLVVLGARQTCQPQAELLLVGAGELAHDKLEPLARDAHWGVYRWRDAPSEHLAAMN